MKKIKCQNCGFKIKESAYEISNICPNCFEQIKIPKWVNDEKK